MRVVAALGGNALAQKGSSGSADSQLDSARKAIQTLEPLLRKEQVVITHGNGPQVGNLLIQQEATNDVPKMPLDVLDAMTQGQIGYFIASAISKTGLHSATLITRVVVDEADPGFKRPTKPIGPFYETEPGIRGTQRGSKGPEEETGNSEPETGNPKQETLNPRPGTGDRKHYAMDAGRGYRLVVASPKPIKIRESDAITSLLDSGFVVIAVGGGGIPIREDGSGLEAVIDKDHASALLADEIEADLLLMITSVDSAYLDFGKKTERRLGVLSVEEARMHLRDGQFAEGSMKPKIEAAVGFVSKMKGRRAVICSMDNLTLALKGEAGTIVSS